jgi:cytosine/adenosine deaminase-related metal-dependent hydrolase
MAASLQATGLRSVLCYEVTDRNGPQEARDGVEENLRFIEKCGSKNKTTRGMMGLHASFTLREDTLKDVAKRTPSWAGVHIHVAEDKSDVEYSENIFGAPPVERLRRHGLLSEHAILAHCIHLSPAEYKTIAEHKAIVVHNSESNANNGVGRFDVYKAAEQGCFVTLGTDGMSSNMLRSLRYAFLSHRGATMDPTSGWTIIPELLHNNALAARRFLDTPQLGQLVVGAPADIIVVDAPPPTPIHSMNVGGHLIFGASENPVRHTIGQGRVLMEHFEIKIRDAGEIVRRARQLSPALWKTFEQTKGNTPLPR